MTTTKKRRPSAAEIIAATISMDLADLKEYRYQSTRTRQPIYAIGDKYFAVSAAKPKDDDYKWKAHRDQFWATPHGVTLWIAMNDE